MATDMKPQTTNLPSIVQLAHGTLAAAGDEISNAFGGAIANQQRAEAPGITFIKLDHKTGRFLVNGEPCETVEGYPIHWFQARAYWGKGYKAGEHSPPDCASMDMLKPDQGVSMQAEACYECPMAAWGSGRDGSGQACKVSTFLFLLNPEFGAPPVAALIAPPSSIRSIVGTGRNPGYLKRAQQVKHQKTGRAAQYHEIVWSRFSLERAGDLHCIIQPEPVMVAETADEARAIAAVRGKLLTEMEALRGRITQAQREE